MLRVTLSGCDDSSAFDIDATEAEAAFLARVAAASLAASEYYCQPQLYVDPAPEGAVEGPVDRHA